MRTARQPAYQQQAQPPPELRPRQAERGVVRSAEQPDPRRSRSPHDFAPAAFAPAPPAECGYAEVLAEVLGVDQVPVESNFFEDLGADSMTMTRFCARLRKRPDLPNVTIRDVYRNPTIKALAAALAPAFSAAPASAPRPSSAPAAGPATMPAPAPAAFAPAPPAEYGYAEVLAEVLGVDQVPVESNFFEDLGADSMTMTRFCARLRKRPDLPNVTIRDVYRNPTIKSLTAAFTSTTPADGLAGGSPEPAVPRSTALVAAPGLAQEPVRCIDPPSAQLAVVHSTPVARVASVAVRPAPVGTLRYLLCGALQLLFLLGYPGLIGTGLVAGYEWVLIAAGPADTYLRSVIVGVAGFLGLSLLPILVKWLLIGRWKPQEFPIWSLRYFRFWLVKTLIRTNPLVRFAGSPLYVLYLRLLGAKIGAGATILSPTVPVCTDMLTIGVGALIRKTSTFSGYRAHDGLIQTGPVHIGRDAIVGEATVLDIGSSVGEGAQLGHASSLHAGQAVPYGQRWHGSPAEPTRLTYRRVRSAGCSGLRKVAYSVVQLLLLLGVVLPAEHLVADPASQPGSTARCAAG